MSELICTECENLKDELAELKDFAQKAFDWFGYGVAGISDVQDHPVFKRLKEEFKKRVEKKL